MGKLSINNIMLLNYLKKVKPFVSMFLNLSAETPAPNSPKTKRGANGKFLPKPLLFHLQLPNSKKISRVFCEILSPKNSFRKTESALVPPRLCEAVAGLIHSFSFRSKKVRAKCIITAPEVTCSELRIWSDFAEAKIAL